METGEVMRMSSTEKHRIMLVDDEVSVLNVLRRTFRNRQYELVVRTDNFSGPLNPLGKNWFQR